MQRTIIILAGGASSRMKRSAEGSTADPAILEEVKTKAKAMLAVDATGRPFLDFLLQNIESAGYENVIIVVGERDSSIRGYYEEAGAAKRFAKLEIQYAVQKIPIGQEKPLGTADALLQAILTFPHLRNERFTVCNSDNLYSPTALRLLLEDTHENALIEYDRRALLFPEERLSHFAVVRKDSSGFLLDIIEKPSPDDIRRMREEQTTIGVSMNLWRFSGESIVPFLETVPLHPLRREKELPAAVRLMITQRRNAMFAIPLAEHVPDLTSLVDIPSVRQFIRQQEAHHSK